MTAIALNRLFEYIASLNLSDRNIDWLSRQLQSIKKAKKAKPLDPEIAKIPEEYRCDPYETSPSGDPFFADKRNVEYVRKRLEEPINEDELITIHGHAELDKFLEAL